MAKARRLWSWRPEAEGANSGKNLKERNKPWGEKEKRYC
jgi:hypothetical protein